MAPRPESLQSAIPNPARIRKWECVSKRRIHRSEICIEPQDGGSFGRKGRMDANPIGKRAAGWLHGNSPKGTSRIENRSRAKRAPPKPRDGTLPKKQSRLAQGKTGGAGIPNRSLLRIRPWAREIRAEPAEHGAKTPAGMAAALRKKRTCLPLRQGETYRDRSDGRGCFQRDTRSDGTEERNGQRQAGRGPYSMSSVRRMSQDAKSEAQEQERNQNARGCPFQKWKRQPFFLCSSKG